MIPPDESSAGRLRKNIEALEHTHCECGNEHFTCFSLHFDEAKAIIGSQCQQCDEVRLLILAVEKLDIRRCPFCNGPLLLSGCSFFARDAFKIDRKCYRCCAWVRQHSGENSVLSSMSWQPQSPSTASCNSRPLEEVSTISESCCTT